MQAGQRDQKLLHAVFFARGYNDDDDDDDHMMLMIMKMMMMMMIPCVQKRVIQAKPLLGLKY